MELDVICSRRFLRNSIRQALFIYDDPGELVVEGEVRTSVPGRNQHAT